MSRHRFKVTPFINPSGAKVWRVSGSINGKQIRKNFSDEIDQSGKIIKGSGKRNAKAFCDLKEVERLNKSRDVQTRATRLTADEIRDAEQAVETLRETGKSLTFAVEFFLKHYVPVMTEMSASTAITKYINKRWTDAKKGLITTAQAKRIEVEMDRLKRHFDKRKLEDITRADLEDYLKTGGGSLKTWNNRRAVLSTFYKHAVESRWIESNPVLAIYSYKRKELNRAKGEAETLSAKQAGELMAFLETYKDGRMVNFFAVTLFAGIRPDYQNGEIGKILPEHFDLDHGQINLPHWVSKIGETRIITIHPNLKAWLTEYPLDRFPIIPRNLKKMRLEVRKKFHLGHDVLRHTFCSFLYSKTKDLGDTAMQAGNSADMIRTHYTSYKQPEEVEAFWSIVPAASEGKQTRAGVQ